MRAPCPARRGSARLKRFSLDAAVAVPARRRNQLEKRCGAPCGAPASRGARARAAKPPMQSSPPPGGPPAPSQPVPAPVRVRTGGGRGPALRRRPQPRHRPAAWMARYVERKVGVRQLLAEAVRRGGASRGVPVIGRFGLLRSGRVEPDGGRSHSAPVQPRSKLFPGNRLDRARVQLGHAALDLNLPRVLIFEVSLRPAPRRRPADRGPRLVTRMVPFRNRTEAGRWFDSCPA
jgi:hypothetical protein